MRTRLCLLTVILLFGTAVRLYHLQAQSIWFDEGWSAYAAVQPTLRAAVEADATNPPLYYVLLNAATRGFGDSEFSLRYFSLLFGLLAIALAERLGRQLFSPSAGIGAAFLVAVSPLMWWASQEARMYTLLAVLVLVAALAWHQLQRRPARWAWLALWASELALLYAHNTGPIIVLWLNLITFIAWGIRFIQHRTQISTSVPPHVWGVRREVLIWFAGQIAVGILWSPWFINRFLLLPEANSASRVASQFGLPLLGQLWSALWLGSWGMVIRPGTDLTPFAGIILVLTLIASIMVIPWHKSAAYWLLAHVVMLTGGLIFGLGVLGNEIHGRYLVMTAPLLLTLIGAGLSEKINSARTKKYTTSVFRIIRYVATVIFLAAFAGAVYFLTQNPAYQHDDVRGMVGYYADHLTADDSVVAWSYADRYDLAYYWDRLDVKANRATLPEGADLDTILPLLPTSGDVALNVWYTQRADYRGMMGCLLGDGTINLPEQISFYGMTNALYRSPTLKPSRLKPFDVAIQPLAQVTAVGEISTVQANQALCLPLQMKLNQPTMVDLKAVLIVQNALGWEVARDDAPFADAAQRTTSVLAPDDTLTAYPLLRLPYGAPPGDYSILLRVYDEQAQPSGYDLLASGSNRPARDFPLGIWHITPGADWSQVTRSSDLPVKRDLAVSDELILIADNIQSATLRNGDTIRLSLLWKGQGELPELTLAGEGGWTVEIPPSDNERDAITLDWRGVQIPLDATAGQAVLRLPDGTALATYTIESTPLTTEQPDFKTPLDASFVGVGNLIGYTLESDMLDHTTPFDITLVWQAEQTASVDYTVFVQLIDDATGQVIAQADSMPVANTRPTTTWRPGEYLIDVQYVAFHADALPGTAHLIAGLYDSATGVRVPLTSGADFITLDEAIIVR